MSSSSSSSEPTVSISDAFDGGNIKLLSPPSVSGNGSSTVVVRLEIKPDVYTELEEIHHMQYFAFRATVSGLTGSNRRAPLRVKYVIENGDEVSYPVAWKGTTVCFTSDMSDDDSWRRNRTTVYHDGKLSWEHLHPSDGSVYFAYFPPFGYARHLDLVAKCSRCPSARVYSLGQTLRGREIDCVEVGDGLLQCWIIHRQHPGETQAEFYAEGLLGRLLGFDRDGELDDTAAEVLRAFTFHVVPCMCLDGAAMGHLRTNAAGANLNREWAPKGEYAAPTSERSPEVLHVLRRMDETGVDAFLDVHGDEELPYNFVSGAEHTPNWGERLQNLHGAFVAAYARSNDDMQAHIGYPPPRGPEEVLPYLNVATNQVATRFDCLALTLEMPFKDCVTNPDPDRGWSPACCRRLGASVLEPLRRVRPHLRTDGAPAFEESEKYVEPHDDFVSHEWENEGFKPLRRMYSDHYSAVREAKAANGGGGDANKFQ